MTITTEKERLVKLMDLQEMNAKQFAAEVGIQPGTISNIIKDRNKPSLEVLQRVMRRFPQVNPEWLMMGVGSIYRQNNDSQQTLFDIAPIEDTVQLEAEKRHQERQEREIPKTSTLPLTAMAMMAAQPDSKPRRVKKITILFDDGTFQELE